MFWAFTNFAGRRGEIAWKAYRPKTWLFFPGKDRTRPLTRASILKSCRCIARRAKLTKGVTLPTLRFLLHVVPSGFMRIRHFGFLANRQRVEKLELCRRLLGVKQSLDTEAAARPATDQGVIEAAVPPNLCPACKEGRMVVIEKLERQRTKAANRAAESSPLTTDTS